MPTGNFERRNRMFTLRTETPHEREATRKPIQVERLDWRQEIHNKEDDIMDDEELREHLDSLINLR